MDPSDEFEVSVAPLFNPVCVYCFPADCGDGADHGVQPGKPTGQVP